VHVYINLEGREKGGGTVSAEEYDQIQGQIINLLTDVAYALIDPRIRYGK